MSIFGKLFGNNYPVPNEFTVYDCGTDGDSVYKLTVGKEIDIEAANKLSKIAKGNVLYAIHAYRNGKKENQFVEKDLYLQMKKTMDNF